MCSWLCCDCVCEVNIWRYLELRYEGLGRDKSDRHQCVGSDTWAVRIAARLIAAGKFASCDCTLLTCGCLCHVLCLACASRMHTSYRSIWYTTTIWVPEKEHQKCVNLRQNTQNWPEWAKILCSPSKKSRPAWTKYTTANAAVLTIMSFGRMIWLQCACSSSNFPKTFSSFLWSLNMKQNSWWEIKQRWIIFIEYHTSWSSHHQFSTSWIL